MIKLNATINENDILIKNIEKSHEEFVFKIILKSFEKDKRVYVKNKIIGPSENVIIAECNNEEVVLSYDIDYGIDPIKCTAANVKTIFNIVNKLLMNN